jgi:hypothetical protein
LLFSVQFFVQIHDFRPLSVKSLKALGDRIIADQHFMCRDFANAVSYIHYSFFLLTAYLS